jgi:hypothetical protein
MFADPFSEGKTARSFGDLRMTMMGIRRPLDDNDGGRWPQDNNDSGRWQT